MMGARWNAADYTNIQELSYGSLIDTRDFRQLKITCVSKIPVGRISVLIGKESTDRKSEIIPLNLAQNYLYP